MRRYAVVILLLGLLTSASRAQTTGNCQPSFGEAFLDIGNVRARILNNGNLFWRGSPHVYNVPKGGAANAIFASGLWIGGLVGRQVRMAASTYGPYEFWAGPLDDDGRPPSDCTAFDRVYRVSVDDVRSYESSGQATPDLRDWPTGLGAPTLAADGTLIDLLALPLAQRVDRVIDLEAGERPLIRGDQMLWWIMNDRGNTHRRTDSLPIGLEVHASTFAFRSAGALGNTTFHAYRFFYKGSTTLNDTYVGFFSDPDLGHFADDYVGSDSVLGLGFAYNADNLDEGQEGYGEAPPAVGYDFLQVPGRSPDQGDSEAPQSWRPNRATSFVFYPSGGGVTGDPEDASDMYNYLQARWKDGQKITVGGNGRDFSGVPTNFMFSGNPPEFWSEMDSDNRGTAIHPADRRFIMGAGPFDLDPGDEEQLVLAITTAFGEDHLDSVALLKDYNLAIQAFAASGYIPPEPPAAPRVTAAPSNGSVLLQWNYREGDNNYLDSYRQMHPALGSDVPDPYYRLEGYNVYEYESSTDRHGTLVSVFDVANGVTRVVEGGEVTNITAFGTDSGLRHHVRIRGLRNYKTYYYGVQAYAYNGYASPRVFNGPITRVEVVPTRAGNALTDLGSDFLAQAADNMALGEGAIVAESDPENVGETVIALNLVNDGGLIETSYQLEFIELEASGGAEQPGMSFDVSRADGTLAFDGRTAGFDELPTGVDVVRFDGLSMNLDTIDPGVARIEVVSNLNGPLSPPVAGAPTWLDYPGPEAETGTQQVTSGATWLIVTGQSRLCPRLDCSAWETFVERTIEERGGWNRVIPYDWEIRFTVTTSYAWEPWVTGSMIEVPFELWRVGVGTPDDPSDDVRLIPLINDIDRNGGFNLLLSDHPASEEGDDPFTDWFYWHLPTNEEPGDVGYREWVEQTRATGDGSGMGEEVFGRMSLMNWDGAMGGSVAAGNLNAWMPEPGTTFRISTRASVQPGDRFYFSTRGLLLEDGPPPEVLQVGVTPNPYIGASDYEVSSLTDEVRFTNMPREATVSIFQLSGSRIRTLHKSGPERFLSWNLRTDENLPIASGMYLIHVESDAGEQIIKFGVVKKQPLLGVF